MLKLKLDRPLVVFDIESTGTNKKADRLIDLAVVKFWPDGRAESFAFRVNPERPIPPESTEIHGITDEMVKDCPTFQQIAPRVMDVFRGCDLAGYNILGFDIPLLTEEFTRAGLVFDTQACRVLDAQRIFHKKVPRDLPAALAYYCGEMHLDAHDAMADVQATVRVLEGQFERYADLPRDMERLDEFCNPRHPDWVDRSGKFKWVGREAVINFGKKQGTPLAEIARTDPGFLKWMLKSDFAPDALEIAKNALEGKLPRPPGG
ncbi:MAG TPA: 3'-5' exonuclease [Kiritimatiellia bacterium]|nr:3'-5' exonuclease [Kiritimatiellia bacterium]HRZ13153.1 3'-5' exonuclease [Kiritimatiellia bacterium]HSA17574.1 3'-5' exonuclease [Kiritimatiellia bacterium]